MGLLNAIGFRRPIFIAFMICLRQWSVRQSLYDTEGIVCGVRF